MAVKQSPDYVKRADQCPKCHERRKDSLVWNNNDEVVCQSCGHTYDPLEPYRNKIKED